MMVNTILAAILFISLLVTVFLWVYASIHCESKRITSYIALLATVFLYTLGYLLEITANSTGGGLVATKVMYAGSAFLAPILLIFVADHCAVKINRAALFVLFAIPLAIVALVWTSDTHRLIYTSFEYSAGPGVHRLSITRGPLYYAVHIHASACVLVTVAIAAFRLITWEARYRPNLILLMLGAFIPALGNILYLLRWNIFGVNYTPVSLTILNILFYFNIVRYDLLDFMPIASEMALRSMSESFVLVDADYNFLKANESAIKLFPALQTIKKAGSIGQVQNWPAALLPQKNEEITSPVTFEMPGESHYSANISKIKAKKETILGYIILIQDITESAQLIKKTEEAKARAEEANSAKSRFLANMSHDLRTPLNVILGMNEMIGRGAPLGVNEEIAVWSGEIARTGKSLLALVESVLDVSNVEQGRHELKPAEYAVSDLIRDLAIIGEQEVRARGLTFLVNAAHQIPSKLYGDFDRVRRITANLLSNAAKYTERGSIALEASFDAEKSELRLAVSDTGIGIKEEDIGLIFDKFMRVESTTPGSGLGLSIARELAYLMGGDITVASVWGEGSVFTAVIPQRVADRSPMLWRRTEQKERAYVYSDSFVAPECRVLVVDDNPPNLNVTRLLLDRTRMVVDTAASGAECVEILAAGRSYHALIMDYMMPGMNGVETLLRIREKIPGFAAPAIMCTADAITDAQIFSKAGFATCLTKPVAPAALECALLSVLPKELVTRIDNNTARVSEETNTKYTSLLAPLGVNFGEAMKYADDVDMFMEQAQIFVEGYEESKDGIDAAVLLEDWVLARGRAHSLKGLAGYVGASSLGEMALKMLAACHAQDADYARALLPILRFEWKRARDGLEAFIQQHNRKK